ncbi:hypothetical protein AMAG_16650 [Allomyces macrogynus ATCC 38327]|uniref:Uncharacterized protein n=1 Tax=Allomyces macrogynus (strain ATCC 38327) TaxID=578462 RepID=A0A0L0TBT4_ALLM3|nr:hypothetical protein AMAG_16650 [Allomyces macrogynus ATCC 38327]|eukprot:KNE72160.1 hypothetical protein AMAG_16650 [Allomyces macrogynus ATCC 38327]
MTLQALPDVVFVRLIIQESNMFLLFAVILSALWVLATFRFSTTRGGPGAVVHFLVRGEALLALACDVLNLAIAATKSVQSPTLFLATPLCTPTGTAFFLLNHLSLVLHVTTSALSTGVFRYLFIQLVPAASVLPVSQRLLGPAVAPSSSKDATSSFVTAAAGPDKVPPLHRFDNDPRILASAFGTNPNDIGLTPVRSSAAAAPTEAPPTAAPMSPTASTRHLVIRPSPSVVSHLTTQLDPNGTLLQHRTTARARSVAAARVPILRQVWEMAIASNWRAWSMRVPSATTKPMGDPLVTDRVPLTWLVRCGFVNELVRRFLLVVTPIGYLVLDPSSIYAVCYGPSAADNVMGAGRTAFGFTPMAISFRFWVMYSTVAQLLLTAQAMLGLAVLARHTPKFRSIHEAIMARTHLVRAWRLCQCAVPFLILMPIVVSRLPNDFLMAAVHAFLMRGYLGWRLALLQALFKLVLRNPALRRTLAGRTPGLTTAASLRRANGIASAAVTPTMSRAASANPVSNGASMAAVAGSAASVVPDPAKSATTVPRAAAVLAAADWTRSLARPGTMHRDMPDEIENNENASAVVTLTVPAPGTTIADSDSDESDSDAPRDAPPAAIVRVQAIFEDNRLNSLARRRSSGTLRRPGGSATALPPVIGTSAADLFLTMDSHHAHARAGDMHFSPHPENPVYATADRRAPAAAAAAAVPEADDLGAPMFIVGTFPVPRSLTVQPPLLHPHAVPCEAVAGSLNAVAGSSVGVSHEAVAGSAADSHDSLAKSYTAARDPPRQQPQAVAAGGSGLLIPPGAKLALSVSADSDLVRPTGTGTAGGRVPAVNVIAPTPRAVP